MMATTVSDVSKTCVLRDVVQTHRTELVRSLDASTLFLTYLAKHQLIEPADILKYEHYKEKEKRNAELLDRVLEHEELMDNGYSKFLDALKRSDQEHLAAMLTSIDEELQLVDEYQNVLEQNLQEIHGYLKIESRRTEVRYTTASPEYKRPQTHMTLAEPPGDSITNQGMAEFLYKIHQSTRATLIHFDRCREVIDKLHADCEVVAKKNCTLLEKLRECDNSVRNLLPSDLCHKRPKDKTLQDSEDKTAQDSSSLETDAVNSKHNEADRLNESFRHNIGVLGDRQHRTECEGEECLHVLDNILADIKTRRSALAKYTELPPRDHISNKYWGMFKQFAESIPNTKLKSKIQDLAGEMQLYVHHEQQVTHKHNLGKLQSSTSNNYRNFDQIEHDMIHLDKEIRRGNHQQAGVFLRQVAEATKTEREECLKMVESIRQSVNTRRQKLQEMSTTAKIRRRPVAKRKVTRTLDTNFAKKLAETSQEIKLYMDMETDHLAKEKADMIKKKLSYESDLRSHTTQIRDLQKYIHEAKLECDKYKKLYHQEKALKDIHMLIKPVIPKRPITQSDTNAGISVHKSLPLERYNYGKLSYGATTEVNKDHKANGPTTTMYSRHTQHRPYNNSINRTNYAKVDRSIINRPTRQGIASDFNSRALVPHRRHLDVKPRLTPRAKHLTKLKATIKERQGSQRNQTVSGTQLKYTLRKL